MNRTVGPGAYNPDDFLTKPSVKCTIFGRNNPFTIKTSKNPGPGTYEVSKSLGIQGGTIAPVSARIFPKETSPGPGHYDYERADELVRTSSPQKTISLGKIITNENKNPGPGHYQISPSKTGGISMGQKLDTK